MLGISFSICSCYRIINSFIFLGCFFVYPLNAFQIYKAAISQEKHFEQSWVLRYFNSIDEETEIGELVDFLVTLRESLIHKGYVCPSLLELAIYMQKYLLEQGIEIDEDEMQEIYESINQREQIMISNDFKLASTTWSRPTFELCKNKHKHKHRSNNGEIKMNSKSTTGFMKCLGGALLCIIPIPAVQTVGVGLIVNGVTDLMDGAKEQGDENERLQKLDEQRRRENETLGS
jgi:hypothetical protein